MGNVQAEFLNSEMFPRLAHRANTFAQIVQFVAANPGLIVETGTARIKDNWAGDGQSTLIWDWLCERVPGVKAMSLDLDALAIKTAQEQTKHVQYVVGDSITSLRLLPDDMIERIRLLYLDSFDWSPEKNLDSSFHHMAELAVVWARLPSHCLVVVDDRHADLMGKHLMVQEFMKKMGVPPLFVDYQIGWVKP